MRKITVFFFTQTDQATTSTATTTTATATTSIATTTATTTTATTTTATTTTATTTTATATETTSSDVDTDGIAGPGTIQTSGTSIPTSNISTSTSASILCTPKSTKRAREKEENKLMEEAIGLMRTAVHSRDVAPNKDADSIFGEYVAGELREMHDANLKRHVKFRIQTVLYEAHSQGHYSQPYPY